MDALTLVLFVVGLGLLIVGAELLVRGASCLAIALGISPLVVGLTVVSLGTSSPELAVGIQSAFAGRTELALGNIVGSNICNVLLILGLAALVRPLGVARQLIRMDVPIMIAAALVLVALGLDGMIGRMDGLLLLTGFVGYTAFTVIQSRRETARDRAEDLLPDRALRPPDGDLAQLLVNVGLVMAGLALLVIGSRWLVNGAVAVATAWGVSELVVGLTIVAVGTSLPEIAASIVAGIRRHGDMAVGNVVGSNIANILLILGMIGLMAPIGVPVPQETLTFDIPVMLASCIACLPIFFSGFVVSRLEGAFFLCYYVAYATYLVLVATEHAALPTFNTIMVSFVLPITAVTLAIMGGQAMRRHRRAQQ